MCYLTDQQNRLLKFSLANGTNIIRFRALSLAGWHPIVLQNKGFAANINFEGDEKATPKYQDRKEFGIRAAVSGKLKFLI